MRIYDAPAPPFGPQITYDDDGCGTVGEVSLITWAVDSPGDYVLVVEVTIPPTSTLRLPYALIPASAAVLCTPRRRSSTAHAPRDHRPSVPPPSARASAPTRVPTRCRSSAAAGQRSARRQMRRPRRRHVRHHSHHPRRSSRRVAARQQSARGRSTSSSSSTTRALSWRWAPRACTRPTTTASPTLSPPRLLHLRSPPPSSTPLHPSARAQAWNEVKEFALSVLRQFNVSQGEVRTAAVWFSTAATTLSSLTYDGAQASAAALPLCYQPCALHPSSPSHQPPRDFRWSTMCSGTCPTPAAARHVTWPEPPTPPPPTLLLPLPRLAGNQPRHRASPGHLQHATAPRRSQGCDGPD